MLFFSRHKKQGAEVGRAIKQTLLMGSNSLRGKKMSEVPAVAIVDPYVVGFVIYFSVMSIDMVYQGAVWSSKKRIEFLVECWQGVGLSMDNIQFYTKVMGNQVEEVFWDKEGKYSHGKDAAALVFGSAYDILTAAQLQGDVIVAAKKRAAKIMGIDTKLGFNALDKSVLSVAVCEITIQSHMKQHHFTDDFVS